MRTRADARSAARAPFRPVPQNVFITRLHVRYDGAHFPEDLVFRDRRPRKLPARFVLRHPWNGTGTCAAAVQYRQELDRRRERESQTLASLTGWNIDEIRKKMGVPAESRPGETPVKWWERLWKQ